MPLKTRIITSISFPIIIGQKYFVFGMASLGTQLGTLGVDGGKIHNQQIMHAGVSVYSILYVTKCTLHLLLRYKV